MKWSFAGPIAGMACTNVSESAESLAAAWADNYLCVPKDQPVRFTWSSAGQLPGKTCVRWFEFSETNPTWLDNWLCVERISPIVDVEGQTQWVEPAPVTPAPEPVSTSSSTTETEITHMQMESQGCSSFGLAPLSLVALSWFLRRRR